MKHKTVFVGFGFSLVALIVMRVCQLLFTIESATGFYKPSYSGFGILAATLIIVFSLVVTYFTFTDIDPKVINKEGKLVAVFSALTAGALLAKSVVLVVKDQSAFSVAVAASAVMATVAYVGYAQGIFTNKPLKASMQILAIPFWTLELVYIFIENNDISAVPERAYDIITACLCVLFALQHLKFKAEMLTPFKIKIMAVVGFITAIFCFISTVPRYLVVLIGGAEQLHASAVSDALFPFYGLMIITFIYSTFKKTKQK